MGARVDGILGVLVPALPKVAQGIMIRDARYRLARIAIAMRLYESDHGELPETFDTLAPTYLDFVPLDPTTEEPFQMEKLQDGLRLYSAGVEAMDRREGKDKKPVKVEMFLKSRQ